MSSSQQLLELEDLDIEDIDIFPTEVFDVETSIRQAKSILMDIENENYDYRYRSDGFLYEDNVWSFTHTLLQNSVLFDFENIHSYFASSNPKISKIINDVVKCWSCDITNNYSPKTAAKFLNKLKVAMQSSSGFTKENAYEFITNLNDRLIVINGKTVPLTDSALHSIMLSLNNFYEYFPFEELEYYIDQFQYIRQPELKKKY